MKLFFEIVCCWGSSTTQISRCLKIILQKTQLQFKCTFFYFWTKDKAKLLGDKKCGNIK